MSGKKIFSKPIAVAPGAGKRAPKSARDRQIAARQLRANTARNGDRALRGAPNDDARSKRIGRAVSFQHARR
jgi:hypothetical protein